MSDLGYFWITDEAASEESLPASKRTGGDMNTLVTAGLALVIFAEWQQVNPVQLFFGAGLIVVGGLLVSGA